MSGAISAFASHSAHSAFPPALAPQTWDASEALLAVCRRLWGQPFTAPIYALLLHQWLLIHRDAGGADQRLKHLNVLVSGGWQSGGCMCGGRGGRPGPARRAGVLLVWQQAGAAGGAGGEPRPCQACSLLGVRGWAKGKWAARFHLGTRG